MVKNDKEPQGFPFDHVAFIQLLYKECRGLRHLTASYNVLQILFNEGEKYLLLSQCTLNKALERVCNHITKTLGHSMHYKFWKVAKFLCNHSAGKFSEGYKPHVYSASMTGDLAITQEYEHSVWIIDQEKWLPGIRARTEPNTTPQELERHRMMNFHILEAIVQHQLENPKQWKYFPDYNVLFMAFTFARRGAPHEYSASIASHFASIAVRYEMDESRTGAAVFKGLRRWRNIVPDVVKDLTLKCIWGHKETPRHHQLWHFRRIVNEKGLQDMVSTIQEGVFVLLLSVVNDHIFASLPAEEAADAVVNSLFTRQTRTPKQHADISRILAALTLPRSPYLHLLFPHEATLTTETWMEKINLTSP